MPRMGGPSDANKSQLDYIIKTGGNLNSPYGDTDTPRMKPQIIGGHLFMVEDKQKASPRLEPPAEVKFKRAPRGIEFNPDKINTYPIKLYGYKDEEPVKEVPRRRELQSYTSRDAFSPHRVVPPIDSPSRESFEQPRRPRLQDHLGSRGELPMRRVVYERDEELELVHRVQKDMAGFESSNLKTAYDRLLKHDQQFTDLIEVDKLVDILRTIDNLPIKRQTLILVAAQYIDESTGKINYPKVLSFLEAAVVNQRGRAPAKDSPRKATQMYNTVASPQGGQYFNPVTHEVEDMGPAQQQEKGMAKLLSYLEQQLRDNEDLMELERIWDIFSMADSDKRDRFSAKQIKDLTYTCKIPLQDVLINKMLSHCQMSNDQYNWKKYLELMEKVWPKTLKTGYHIPESKKPKEYVKTMPKPSSNWPNPEDTAQNSKYDYSTLPKNYVHPHHHRNQQVVQHRSQSKQSQVDMLDSQIERVRNQYERDLARLKDQRQAATGDSKSWSTRFEELSEEMYNADRNNRGLLPWSTADAIIRKHNDNHQLNISDNMREEALKRGTIDSGLVNIFSVLQKINDLVTNFTY